jgi:Domain of unknown function (DUF4258)
MNCLSIVFSDHAISQMFKRDISVEAVKQVIETGEAIAQYPNDRPLPSCLISGYESTRPLHVVVASKDFNGQCIVVTAYEPTLDIWEKDFRTKRG